jgi:hypothetical protein
MHTWLRYAPISSRLEDSMDPIVRRASALAVAMVLAGCSSGANAAPSPSSAPSPSMASPSALASPSVEPSVSASATAVPSATSFTSATYGYSLTVPPGWSSGQATKTWDGSSGLSSGSAEVDKFIGPSSASSTGVAAPSDQTLSGYADALVAANAKYHGDTCPARPAARKPITIGGDPATLLEYDCGILINLAVTVHKGVGYEFLLRDPAIHASSDPSDQESFLALLHSVKFPE